MARLRMTADHLLWWSARLEAMQSTSIAIGGLVLWPPPIHPILLPGIERRVLARMTRDVLEDMERRAMGDPPGGRRRPEAKG